MRNVMCLNSGYSTTKILVKNKDANTFIYLPDNRNRKAEGGLRTQGYFKKSYTDKPLISIVTVVYNGERFLEDAIESVINQGYDNVEYIVVDGGSTDNTVNIIKKFEDQIDYWVSEPDEGQSDAFNKAFELVSGDFVSWLNADDILLPNALGELSSTIKKYPHIKWFMGNTIHIDENNCILYCRLGEGCNMLFPKLGIINAYGPSSFFSLDLLKAVEGIDPKIHLRMDTDLWLQFYELGERFMRLENYVWAFRHHSGSKTMGNKENSSNVNDKGITDRGRMQFDKEVEYMRKKHKHRQLTIVSKLYMNLIRAFSIRYLFGLLDSLSYKHKPYLTIAKKLKK